MLEFLHSEESTPALFSSAVTIDPIEEPHGDLSTERRFKVQAQRFKSPGIEFDPITVFTVSATPDGCVLSQDEAYLVGKPEKLIESINLTTTQQTLVNRISITDRVDGDDSTESEVGAVAKKLTVVSECKLSITCGKQLRGDSG